MIDMQYQEQRLTAAEQGLPPMMAPAPPVPSAIGTIRSNDSSAETKSTAEQTVSSSSPPRVTSPVPPYPPPRHPRLPSVGGASASSEESGIGYGTLFWASDAELQQQGGPEGSSMNSLEQAPGLLSQGLTRSVQHLHLSDYGAVSEEKPSEVVTAAPLPPDQKQQHDYHYGNPDVHDPWTDDHLQDSLARRRHHQDARQRSSSLWSSFCCLCDPLCRCLKGVWSADSLHRSFCYGAIDGMLTGAGIVSTFCGMNLLSDHSTHAIRALVVAFTAATCFADSVCMALVRVV
jgi:hypothetical protein